jgi:hypothetical protein
LTLARSGARLTQRERQLLGSVVETRFTRTVVLLICGWAATRLPRHPFADVVVGMVRCGHDQTGSSSSSTTPQAAGVMPDDERGRAVSESTHTAAACRQRISPARKPLRRAALSKPCFALHG